MQLLHGDCRDILKTLPNQSVQCVVTSPPYWGLRDYGVEGQIGLEDTPALYVAALVDVFREVRRVLRGDGTLWLNLGDSYSSGGGGDPYRRTTSGKLMPPQMLASAAGIPMKNLLGIPWRVAFALQDDGWILRSDIIWSKPNAMPESVTDRPTREHEYLFLLSKSPRYFYDVNAIREPHKEASLKRVQTGLDTDRQRDYPGAAQTIKMGDDQQMCHPAGRNRRTVWTIATQPFSGAHFATMPEALIEPCILAGSSSQACETCGATWGRVMERDKGANESQQRPKRTSGMDSHTSTLSLSGNHGAGWHTNGSKIHDRGFAPRCACAVNTGSAASVVLDPFGGSGTVARVAERYQRNAILIDLNADYIELQEQRTNGVQVELFV